MCTLHAGVGLVRLRIFVSGVLYTRVVITERTWQKSAAQSPLSERGGHEPFFASFWYTSQNHEPITNVISAPPPPLWSFLVAVQKRWRRQQHWSRAVAQAANKPPPVPTSSPRRRYSAASASTRLRHIAASPPPGERHTQRLTPHTLSMPSFMGSAHSKPGASDQF